MGMRRRFAERRCLVAGHDSLAEAIERRLTSEGGTVAMASSASPLSTEPGAVEAIDAGVRALGGLDVLVTAFCVRDDAPFLEIDDETWASTLDGNLKAAFLVGREAARAMVADGRGGVIVHVGSDVAARPGPGTAAYAAAKAGVHLLATSMALDLAPDGVRVCAVAACEDGCDPIGGGLPGPDDVAAAVAFCASGEASYVLGSTLFLNGPLPVRS